MNQRTAKSLLHDFLFLHAALWVLWLGYAFGVASSLPEGDWFVLREVAKSFVAGDWGSLYSDRVLFTGTYHFRYPPFVLYLIAPLAAVPPMLAYTLVCVIQLAAAVAALLLLFRIRRPTDIRLLVVGIFGSAAICHVLVSGQNSGLLTVAIASVCLNCASGRGVRTGACVGLLACKPNWLPVFATFVLWRGGVRAGAGAALTAAAFALSTLPLGVGVWRDFLTVTTRTGEISAGYAAFKEITLLACFKSLFGWGVFTKALWGLCLVGLVALAIRAIRDSRPIGRSLALITLLAVVANPYASFYDGLVLIVPATLWLAHRNDYQPRTWRIVGAWIAAYWFWDMGTFYYRAFLPGAGHPQLSAGGFLLAGWLVTEALAGVPRAPVQ